MKGPRAARGAEVCGSQSKLQGCMSPSEEEGRSHLGGPPLEHQPRLKHGSGQDLVSVEQDSA